MVAEWMKILRKVSKNAFI
jgi:hypothetical protein